MASQTRLRGALRVTCFSMRSVELEAADLVVMMHSVSHGSGWVSGPWWAGWRREHMQPSGCVSRGRLRLAGVGRFRIEKVGRRLGSYKSIAVSRLHPRRPGDLPCATSRGKG